MHELSCYITRFDCVYTFDLIKQNLNQVLLREGGHADSQSSVCFQRRYRRLDAFQDDLFKVFERARLLTPTGSQVDQDAAVLQRYYLRVRDEMCGHGSLLGSPALLFDEHRLKQDIERNRIEKDALARTRDQNSTSTMKSTGDADKKNLVSTRGLLVGRSVVTEQSRSVNSVASKSSTTMYTVHRGCASLFNSFCPLER